MTNLSGDIRIMIRKSLNVSNEFHMFSSLLKY